MRYVQDLVMDLCKSMLWKRVLSFYLSAQSVLYWNASVLWNTFKEFVFLWFLQKLQLRPCYFFYACVNVSEATRMLTHQFSRFSVVLIYFNWRIFLRRWVAIYDEFATTYQLNLEPKFQDFLNVVSFTSSVLVHDAIYQFLRIFYQSRFKPDTLR